ncbi:WxcM-like domain-containing protein [uncultured Chryseobacterium sp.]|mgnify:CR=1 FL=1|uniref:WxcM-like domain-containing protein n=1 Tax=uncultured Chryseobacterium sp. TaxID=259322 RepID=UPI002637A934|nr:WxcM-like domain-containing protein [uncultured Chryseobacterium sp.]
MMILKGNQYEDARGIITSNNEFDVSQVKRIYTIENHSTEFIRGWQGHAIEQRWFACMKGRFKIYVIKVDDFEKPSKDLPIQTYELSDKELTYLHVKAGCITAIQGLEKGSKLIALSDYAMGEVNDEYRFDLDYFINKC